MKKIIGISILIFLLVFIIYKSNDYNLIDYMVVGDSMNLGINSYGNITYGYNDYLKDYLENSNLLHKYNNYFVKNEYKIRDLVEDIKNNKNILYNDKTYNIKKELREADLVTVAIGMDELVKILNNKDIKDFAKIQKDLDVMVNNMEELIKSITALSKKKIVLIGYYNPYTNNITKDVDQILAYISDKYKNIASKYSITYIDIYNLIKKDVNYLPNKLDYHLTSKGYLQIAKEIITKNNL